VFIPLLALMYLKAFFVLPSMQPKFQLFPEQSTSCCSLRDTSFPVFLNPPASQSEREISYMKPENIDVKFPVLPKEITGSNVCTYCTEGPAGTTLLLNQILI